MTLRGRLQLPALLAVSFRSLEVLTTASVQMEPSSPMFLQEDVAVREVRGSATEPAPSALIWAGSFYVPVATSAGTGDTQKSNSEKVKKTRRKKKKAGKHEVGTELCCPLLVRPDNDTGEKMQLKLMEKKIKIR